MLAVTRAITALLLLAGCDHAAERKLVGTWRTEKDGAVEELALRADHTLVWWMCPAELSTPQTLVSSGKWNVRGKRIEVESKQLAPPTSAERHSLQILKLDKDLLVVKPTNKGDAIEFQRLDVPSCGTPAPGSMPVDVEPNIAGTWQVHYHTRQFRYRFARDHTVTVSGMLSGEFQPLWKGSWSVSGGDLLMELKPDSYGMGELKPHWKLYGFQRDCFWIKDPEGIEYLVHRTE
jgi:hypothetical protein